MIAGLDLDPRSLVLDVAAGTGSITRQLEAAGHRVVPLDQSQDMLAQLRGGSVPPVVATGERLPFPTGTFDAVTFGYLLRYVEDVPSAMSELARVVRPGGRLGMVEFGRPRGLWRPLWVAHTRVVLPLAGRVIGPGWHRVGTFLGGSIDSFAEQWPERHLAEAWEGQGLVGVEHRRMSLGGGIVMWGTRS